MLVDSLGRTPWVSRASSMHEHLAHAPYAWTDPYQEKPEKDVAIEGVCAACRRATTFRLGLELWHPAVGFLYREALSCQHCTLNARMRAALQYVDDHIPLANSAKIYMTERVTPLFDIVAERYPNTEGSEYLPGEPLGTIVEGIRCEDLTQLTYGDENFDVTFTFDVLEHVPDYRAAAKELFRTLKCGGWLLLTVPFCLARQENLTLARLLPGDSIEHLHPAQYHGNPLGPPSLCFSDFAWDLLEVLREAGFVDVQAVLYANMELGYLGEPQPLIVGRRR